jgi:hypothetical protein
MRDNHILNLYIFVTFKYVCVSCVHTLRSIVKYECHYLIKLISTCYANVSHNDNIHSRILLFIAGTSNEPACFSRAQRQSDDSSEYLIVFKYVLSSFIYFDTLIRQ